MGQWAGWESATERGREIDQSKVCLGSRQKCEALGPLPLQK